MNKMTGSMMLLLALLILASGCATTPGSDKRLVGTQIATHALTMSGKPYRYGGSDPSGFDCSGLVLFAHRQAGIEVPRTTQTQYRQASRVAYSEIQPGDLLFFRIAGKLSHVGLYTGNGQFVHAPGRGRSVTTANLNNPYWQQHLLAAGRLH